MGKGKGTGAARVETLEGTSGEAVLAHLRAEAEAGRLYGVLDAARDPAVLRLLKGGGEEHRSLYNGRRGENLAGVAPYLVRFSPQSALLSSLVEQGFGRGWGIYVTSELPFNDIRRHLRTLLVVETREGEGQPLYFRFYDPRALRPFLTSCTLEEAARLFGPLRSFLVEARGVEARALLRALPPEEVTGEMPLPPGPLRVRTSQLAVFSRELLELFIDRMAARLRKDYAPVMASFGVLDEAALRDFVRRGIRRAGRHGIIDEPGVERFIELSARLGPDFGAQGTWEGRVLRRRDIDGTAKLNRIERHYARVDPGLSAHAAIRRSS
jgi:hypothetical protein